MNLELELSILVVLAFEVWSRVWFSSKVHDCIHPCVFFLFVHLLGYFSVLTAVQKSALFLRSKKTVYLLQLKETTERILAVDRAAAMVEEMMKQVYYLLTDSAFNLYMQVHSIVFQFYVFLLCTSREGN